MQAKVLNLYKPIGVTPFQLIEKFKKENPEYLSQKLGYAGRLDPMAEGVLLVLVGEENKKRKEYENLPKEYEFDVLFGIKTDSYDILGKIVSSCHPEGIRLCRRPKDLGIPRDSSLRPAKRGFVQNDIKNYIGKYLQEYPPYSSPRVNGKPLFWWARENRLSEIEIPKKEIEIYELGIIKSYKLASKELKNIIKERISKVKGVFRQEEILKGWEEFFNVRNDKFNIITFKVSCSSGTYIRSIANEMGGVALNIKRTKAGDFSIRNSLRV